MNPYKKNVSIILVATIHVDSIARGERWKRDTEEMSERLESTWRKTERARVEDVI